MSVSCYDEGEGESSVCGEGEGEEGVELRLCGGWVGGKGARVCEVGF